MINKDTAESIRSNLKVINKVLEEFCFENCRRKSCDRNCEYHEFVRFV